MKQHTGELYSPHISIILHGKYIAHGEGGNVLTIKQEVYDSERAKHFGLNWYFKNLAPAEMSIEVDFRSPSATAAWRREPPWPPYWQFTASLKMSLKDDFVVEWHQVDNGINKLEDGLWGSICDLLVSTCSPTTTPSKGCLLHPPCL